MAEPKRKKSKSKVRMRRRSHKIVAPAAAACPNCGQPRQSHRICPSCGHYKGRQVISVEVT